MSSQQRSGSRTGLPLRCRCRDRVRMVSRRRNASQKYDRGNHRLREGKRQGAGTYDCLGGNHGQGLSAVLLSALDIQDPVCYSP